MPQLSKDYADQLADPNMGLFQLFTEIGIIDQLLQTQIERLLAPELNLAQFALLNHMSRCGEDASLVQLAAAMQVTKPAMTNTVGRLAGNDLVSVVPDEHDKRGKRVSLTHAGVKAHQRAIGLLSEHLQVIQHLMEPQDLETTLQCLGVVRRWLDTNRGGLSSTPKSQPS
jgi:DNA-binding MarR family transcriptional regulator